jgi:hypothetical protein
LQGTGEWGLEEPQKGGNGHGNVEAEHEEQVDQWNGWWNGMSSTTTLNVSFKHSTCFIRQI